jgi:hypothetical protein
MERGGGAGDGRKARWRRRREPQPSCDFCAARGDGGEFTVFGCRDFTICYGRDAAGTTLIWSPDLGIPGEITDVRQHAGGAEVTMAPAAGSAHPSEVVTGQIAAEHHHGGWWACGRCAPLAAAQDWAGLARRFGGGAFAGDPAAVAVITAQLELFGWFATGERWPLAQAPVP